jgi:hypothetical protein
MAIGITEQEQQIIIDILNKYSDNSWIIPYSLK